MRRMVLSAALIGIAAGATASGASLRVTPWPQRFAAVHQVSGCLLEGAAFGQIFTGGGVVAGGKRHAISDVKIGGGQITYSGPDVTATFTPAAGKALIETDDGAPTGTAAAGPRGMVRIVVGGRSATLPAREACMIYE